MPRIQLLAVVELLNGSSHILDIHLQTIHIIRYHTDEMLGTLAP